MPCCRRQVLDRDRDATERGVASRSVGGSRILERLVATDGDERVQLGIEPFDPIEVELGELERGNLSVAHHPCLLGRRDESELHRGEANSSYPGTGGPAQRWTRPELQSTTTLASEATRASPGLERSSPSR